MIEPPIIPDSICQLFGNDILSENIGSKNQTIHKQEISIKYNYSNDIKSDLNNEINLSNNSSSPNYGDGYLEDNQYEGYIYYDLNDTYDSIDSYETDVEPLEKEIQKSSTAKVPTETLDNNPSIKLICSLANEDDFVSKTNFKQKTQVFAAFAEICEYAFYLKIFYAENKM